ncbi:histidine ammonia-lyase [Thermoactinomyces sp. AMNI-1]|uniref:Histidine ammonia-lyase n=2 Tax=Thermoactinomyces mirandus TaxID=2756294 RepID=A0A7W1XSR8_9BACL|nr:histidine ammonia-lyase [Thermoactinomyces mirandus]MBA4602477.1 histidine ammonia-lyase [Thermoactinomyces mirandus]
MSEVIINGSLEIEDIIKVARGHKKVRLAPGVVERIRKSRELVDRAIKESKVVYGVTTGFGKFSNVLVSSEETRVLQENLIMSHSTGVGEALPEEIVRAVILLRANTLSRGYSGVRVLIVEKLLELLNKEVHPVIPCKGSLGASGDLVPLAHMALVLIGKGEAVYKGTRMAGEKALEKAKIEPVQLQEKEGLALINGTPVMTAIAALAVHDAEILVKTGDISAALTLEALKGITSAYNHKIHEARPHKGQIAVAKNILRLIQGSEYLTRQGEARVQDAYSLRCVPQVHGASRDAVKHVKAIVKTEVNSVTDNPLIFPEEEEIISGGNFHGQPIAINLDYLKIAVSELASISERRIERMVNPQLSNGLPAFLIKKGGLNSGMMITQYVAAALVSENKSISHPASVDSIPSSANQEDHVSMGTIASRQAMEIVDNVRNVLAIELMCAAQSLDMREGKKLGKGTRIAYDLIRSRVKTLNDDRILYRDIKNIYDMIKDGTLAETVEKVIGNL